MTEKGQENKQTKPPNTKTTDKQNQHHSNKQTKNFQLTPLIDAFQVWENNHVQAVHVVWNKELILIYYHITDKRDVYLHVSGIYIHTM